MCTRARRGERIVFEADGLGEVGWDYVDAPSCARGVLALLLAPHRPARFVYELALGRTVPHEELLAAVAAAPHGMADAMALAELVPPGDGAAAQGSHRSTLTLAPRRATSTVQYWYSIRGP